MAAYTDKSVFYHIPKTGGTWVKEAMRRSGLRYRRCKNRKVGHPFGLKREHATPDVIVDEHKAGRFSFCFVRHPVGWLRSRWCYRVMTQVLDPKSPLSQIWDDSFRSFVVNVLERYSNGFVTELYQFYVGADADGVDFVGRQENLADDLVSALTLAGEDFDERALRAMKRINVASGNPEFGRLCVLDAGLELKVIDADRWVMDTFYG